LKVLFDQNAPRPLARFLAHHQVIRSAELGWSSLKNGELLQAAEQDGFDVMVTADRNLAYQQNLRERLLAIVEKRAKYARDDRIGDDRFGYVHAKGRFHSRVRDLGRFTFHTIAVDFAFHFV